MNKRKSQTVETSLVRMMDVNMLQVYISMGRTNAVTFAREAGAEKRIGRRCLYDRWIIDKALDALPEG